MRQHIATTLALSSLIAAAMFLGVLFDLLPLGSTWRPLLAATTVAVAASACGWACDLVSPKR